MHCEIWPLQFVQVDGLLERLQQGVLLPTAITTGLFVLPSTTKEGDPLEIAIDRKGGLINTPRIVAVDHTGSFRCRCGSKACKEHDVSFLAEVREQESWWGPLLDEGSVSGIGAAHVAPYINERVVGQAFEVTAGCRAGRIPLSEGRLGARLVGADAAAWRGACLRAVIAITETGPAVCILREDTGAWVCGACERDQMCSHVRVASQLIGAEQKSALVEAKHEATPIGESVRSRLERVEERISQRNGRGTLRVGSAMIPPADLQLRPSRLARTVTRWRIGSAHRRMHSTWATATSPSIQSWPSAAGRWSIPAALGEMSASGSAASKDSSARRGP